MEEWRELCLCEIEVKFECLISAKFDEQNGHRS